MIFGCVIGAAIGNKAVHWMYHAEQCRCSRSPRGSRSRQSIVGGLLGGLIGVEIGKKYAGVTESTGDRFVVPILVGLHHWPHRLFHRWVGRTIPTGIPPRCRGALTLATASRAIPRSCMTFFFAVAALASAARVCGRRCPANPGLQFKLLLAGYLLWRLAHRRVEARALRVPGGLSGIQLVCAAALVLYLPLSRGSFRGLRT